MIPIKLIRLILCNTSISPHLISRNMSAIPAGRSPTSYQCLQNHFILSSLTHAEFVEESISYDSHEEKKKTQQIPHSAGNDTTLVSLPVFFDAKNRTQNTQIPFARRLLPSPGKAVSAFVISDTKGGLS
jgi:hypothetical protein